MMTKTESKTYTKNELVELCIKEAWEKKARFSKNGKKHVPDGYKEKLSKMSKSELVTEYNALCVEE